MPKLTTASAETKTSGDLRDSNTAAQLYRFVESLERLAEEKAGLTEDMKEVRGEAKAMGFDTAILNKVIQRRKLDADARNEADALLDLYESVVQEQEKKQTAQSLEDGE